MGVDDVLARSEARPIGQRLDAQQAYTEGSDLNIVLASASAMAEEVLRQDTLRVKALFLDGAEGEDLDRIVADRFSPTIVRKQATPALVTLSLFRTAGALPLVTFAIGTRFRTTGGVEFETTSVASVPAASMGPITVPAQAVDAGTQGNTAVGTITEFSSPPSDPNLQVTNPAVAAGGDDAETDARLRSRARDFYRTARRGTLAAIEFGALTVNGVRQATAIEELDTDGIQTGRVFLYIADALGNGNAALVSAVQIAELEYRAAGIILDIFGATPLFVEIQLRLRFQSGIDTVAAFASVQAAVAAAVNGLRPAETLPASLITASARSIPGVIVLDDALVAPVGDVVPTAGQVLRTNASLITSVPP